MTFLSQPFALPFPWVSQYISVLQLLYCCTFTSSWMVLHFVLVQYTNGFISSYCSGISGTMFLHCMARCWLLIVLLLQVNTISKVTGLRPTDHIMFTGPRRQAAPGPGTGRWFWGWGTARGWSGCRRGTVSHLSSFKFWNAQNFLVSNWSSFSSLDIYISRIGFNL